MAEYCSSESIKREMKVRTSSWSENESQLKRPKQFSAVSETEYLAMQ